MTIAMMTRHKYRKQLTSPVCVQSQRRSWELVRERESYKRVMMAFEWDDRKVPGG